MTAGKEVSFGSELKRLRVKAGLTQPALVALLAQHGHVYSGAAVGTWERGENTPRSAQVVADLELVLGAIPGQLAVLTDFTTQTDIGDRIDRIERTYDGLKDGQIERAREILQSESATGLEQMAAGLTIVTAQLDEAAGRGSLAQRLRRIERTNSELLRTVEGLTRQLEEIAAALPLEPPTP